MEITEDMALNIGMDAGDSNMRAAGRDVWSAEDAAVATAVYKRLAPVQKMDEIEGAE